MITAFDLVLALWTTAVFVGGCFLGEWTTLRGLPRVRSGPNRGKVAVKVLDTTLVSKGEEPTVLDGPSRSGVRARVEAWQRWKGRNRAHNAV